MFTLHIGMPKTGTTTIQTLLAGNENALQEKGVIYPEQWRDEERIAHHQLGVRMLDASPGVVSDIITEVVDFVSRNNKSKIIISTESITNMLNGRKVDDLFRLLSEVGAIMPVNFVICLRRIDEFFESMYLHSVKVGEQHGSLEQYILVRERWAVDFFEALFFLRHRRAAATIRYIPYRKDKNFLAGMAHAMGVPGSINLYDSGDFSLNRKLGVKAQSALLFLPQVETKIGKQINRRRLIHALDKGMFCFSDETYNYRVIPPLWAKFYHELSLRLALEMRILEYYESFRSDSVGNYKHQELSLERLQEEDLSKLSDWVEQDILSSTIGGLS